MINILGVTSATALVALLVLHPQVSWADGFTGKSLLSWDRSAQIGYIQTSMNMVSAIASQNDRSTAECIGNWYFDDKAVQNQRNDEIRHLIRQNSEYHPSSVILARIYQVCGRF